MYVNLKINIKNSMKRCSHINIVMKFLTKRKKHSNCSARKRIYRVILTWWAVMGTCYVINYAGLVVFIDHPGVHTVLLVTTVLKGLIIIVLGLALVLEKEIITIFLLLSPLYILSLSINFLLSPIIWSLLHKIINSSQNIR